ncbi:MAG: phage tail terminator-like protein [Candidatus Thioglobus sp.]
MTSFAAERASIEGRLSSNWTTTAIAYDNVDFDAVTGVEWIRLTILPAETNYRALEAKKRFNGIISIQIFSPRNKGTATIRTYADTLSGIFVDQKFDDVVCRSASITSVAQLSEWHQINLNIPFWRDS